MTLTERLREYARTHDVGENIALLWEAAGEIETLRGRVDLLEHGFPVIKVVGHIVNHMERRDGAIILEVGE